MHSRVFKNLRYSRSDLNFALPKSPTKFYEPFRTTR